MKIWNPCHVCAVHHLSRSWLDVAAAAVKRVVVNKCKKVVEMYNEGAGVCIHLLKLVDFSNEAPVSTTMALLSACHCCVSQELHCCLWNRKTCIGDSSWTCWMKDYLPGLTPCGTFIFLAVPVHMVLDIKVHCGGLLSGIQLSHSAQHFKVKSYEIYRSPW